jgi:hypothetical protein
VSGRDARDTAPPQVGAAVAAYREAMPDGAGLARLVDASAILSAEQQAHVAALHGDDHWAVDIAGAAVVLTAPDGQTLTCRAHFLGTSAPGPKTWLWGWRNINRFPEDFVALAERIRAAGEAQGVPELTTAELPLTDALPRRLTVAAKTVSGLPMHYSGPIGGGSRAWLLIEHPDLELPPPTARRTADAILAAIDTVEIADHAEAVAAWARQRGVALTADEPDGQRLRLALADGDVLVTFDERHRISRVEEQTMLGLDVSTAAQLEPVATDEGRDPGEPVRPGASAPEPEVERTEPPEQEQEQRPESAVRRLLGWLRGPEP